MLEEKKVTQHKVHYLDGDDDTVILTEELKSGFVLPIAPQKLFVLGFWCTVAKTFVSAEGDAYVVIYKL